MAGLWIQKLQLSDLKPPLEEHASSPEERNRGGSNGLDFDGGNRHRFFKIDEPEEIMELDMYPWIRWNRLAAHFTETGLIHSGGRHLWESKKY
ncbi:hypothetical protein [Bacillus sp. REN3]|uniref:hypothetical protein n=1 Tax=Bacillus sp. REN3 TaxID=2802440 RepID=UPI001AED9A59|nr:hypothetical protein [Bacillus sp. REN3]